MNHIETTVSIELPVKVHFHEESGMDDFGNRYCQPIDYVITSREGNLPEWLVDKIIDQCEEEISEDCQVVLDASKRDRLEEEKKRCYEEQMDRR